MEFGVFLPVSGRAATRETLIDAAQKADEWGFTSVWCADRMIIPWELHTEYPYSEGNTFIVPPDRPFLEPLTTLAFLAGATERIKLGISVMVLPYRHPIFAAKIATTIDNLSKGRFILGLGVGWMVEEFEAMNVPFESRGRMSTEEIEIFNALWEEEHSSYQGEFFQFEDIAFFPKPYQQPRTPLWLGGEGRPAQRRAAKYGDSWFPYFVRITPAELQSRYDYVRSQAAELGRDPDAVALNACLPIEVTPEPVEQAEDSLRGTPEQLVEAIARFGKIGVGTLALQFMVPRYPDRVEQIERFAGEALPELTA